MEQKILNDIKKIMDEINYMVNDCNDMSKNDPDENDVLALIGNLDTDIKYYLRPLMRKLKKKYKEGK